MPSSISWSSPTQPLPTEVNPRVAFERLFGDVGSTESKARVARLRRDRSILDSVTQAAAEFGIPEVHTSLARLLESRELALVRIEETEGWIQAVAQSWLVLQLTGSPLKLGLISTLQFAPVLLFSIIAGAAADRLHKRRVLIASQTTYLCQAVLLAVLVWTGTVQYWHVCALALVLELHE